MDDEEADERNADCRSLVRAWLVEAGWPQIETELLLEVRSPSRTGRRRIVRLRPAPSGVAVHNKVGTKLWLLWALPSDGSGYRLPAGMLGQLVRLMPAEAGRPRLRRRPGA